MRRFVTVWGGWTVALGATLAAKVVRIQEFWTVSDSNVNVCVCVCGVCMSVCMCWDRGVIRRRSSATNMICEESIVPSGC